MTSDRLDASLDPEDWEQLRNAAHALLDRCIDHLSTAADHPWQPVPEAVRSSYALSPDAAGLEDPAALAEILETTMLPYGTGNTHPRFFGWVHGTGLAEGLLSEMVAATINANCGGRDHGMIYVERAVIDWARRVMGLPATSSGVLTAGTSQATVIAAAAARLRALGPQVRSDGVQGAPLVAYGGEAVHSAAQKAIELLGIGSNNLRRIPMTDVGMDIAALRDAIRQDKAAGLKPFLVVGTAGTVDFGQYDDLGRIAGIAQEEGLWFHVDGAFGAWTRLADDPWRRLSDGIDRADSIACDFHKWMYVPYDCGLVLIRNEAEHRAAFAARPSYLAPADAGLAGGDPWFCDYGIDLSRGNRALKVWAAIRAHGAERFGKAITANCKAAAHMGALVRAQPRMRLMAPVVSNLCVFTADDSLDEAAQSALNSEIAKRLQLSGEAVFSTTHCRGITCLRAAITNHRTDLPDVELAIAAVAREAEALR